MFLNDNMNKEENERISSWGKEKDWTSFKMGKEKEKEGLLGRGSFSLPSYLESSQEW